MEKQTFYNTYVETAKKISQNLGGAIPFETILAVLSWETDYGKNRGARELNNLAGIKYTTSAGKLGATKSGMYAKYPSLDAFAQDMARVLKLSYYDGIRRAGQTADHTDDFVAWNKSPYAEDDYNIAEMVRRVNEIKKLTPTTTPVVTGGTINLNEYVTKAKQMTADDLAIVGAIGLAVVALVGLMKD